MMSKKNKKINFPSFNHEQADNIVAYMKDMFGKEVTDVMDQSNLNMNHLVRFLYLSKLCQNTREEKGLSLKDISNQLKIPQYKLKAIENNEFSSFTKEILEEYIIFLGLKKQFDEWLENNRDVYEGIGR